MDTLAKLQLLGESAKYDICSASAAPGGPGVCHSFTPDGRCISLLRVLMSNQCVHNCSYCPNRSTNDCQRAEFSPEELAGLFMQFYRRNYVSGLFLSSGVSGCADAAMGNMLDTAQLLRQRHGFKGYIHLKLIPGCSSAHIDEAVRLAQRVSVNCETPDGTSLGRVAPGKDYQNDIINTMERVRKLTDAAQGRQSTQFLVGAAGEADRDILARSLEFYDRYNMLRVYFSAYVPLQGTVAQAVPLVREQRLYQCDFLLRQYGFSLDELVFDGGNLPLDEDPKQAWARANPQHFPLEVNKASREQLLRVPGIGPRSASRIVALRRQHRITRIEELKNIGVVVKRAAPHLLAAGRRLARGETPFKQLDWLNPAGMSDGKGGH